jgi:23S rRNA pseudouridine2457 synthase
VLIALNKPYGVLSQFTEEGSRRTLAEFGFPSGVYPIGRLDADSEGLLLLSDEPGLNGRLLHPSRGHERIYWAQVEGAPGETALKQLCTGVIIQGYKTRRCKARVLEPRPDVAERTPPIRYRKRVPDTWVELILTEGKNRQVRRMTAAVGHPTLRLLRVAIGKLQLGDLGLEPGEWKELDSRDRELVLK